MNNIMATQDGYVTITSATTEFYLQSDGYSSSYNKQINIKVTEEDICEMNSINKDFFENEATNSMLGRILLRKGIQFYKALKNKF